MSYETDKEFYDRIFGKKNNQQKFETEMAIPSRKAPVTFGLEIEQTKSVIMFNTLRRQILVKKIKSHCHGSFEIISTDDGEYTWCLDGSGPIETQLGPSKKGAALVEKFVRTVHDNDIQWNWTSYNEGSYTNVNCGSHMHFRLVEDLFLSQHEKEEAWSILYNTLVDLSMLTIPLLAYGGYTNYEDYYIWDGRDDEFNKRNYRFRKSANYYSRLKTTRYKPSTLARKMAEQHGRYGYHDHIMLNKNPGKPLTIEVRLAETHPAIAYFTLNLYSQVIREAIKSGESPKIGRTKSERDRIIENIDNAIFNQSDDVSLWQSLEQVSDINFARNKPIPRLKEHYNNYLGMFDDLLTKYWQSRAPMRRIGELFRQKGIPHLNNYCLWNVFAEPGQFTFNQYGLKSSVDNTIG